MIFAHTRDPPFYYKIGAKISRKFKSQNDLAKLKGIFVLNKQYMDSL